MANLPVNGNVVLQGSISGTTSIGCGTIGGNTTIYPPNSVPFLGQTIVVTDLSGPNNSIIQLGWANLPAGGGASTIALSQITQSGATTGQTIEWSGTAWVPTSAVPGEGTVTSVATAGIATGGTITGAGTITVTGSSTNGKTTAVTDAGSITGASAGFVVTTDGHGNVANGATLLSSLVTTSALATALGLYLPLTGGSLSGDLTLSNASLFVTGNGNGEAIAHFSTGTAGSPASTFAVGIDVNGNLQLEFGLKDSSGSLGTNGQVLTSNGTVTLWQTPSAGSVAFSAITAGTNTNNAFVIGNSGSLTYTGTGTINASSLGGVAAASYALTSALSAYATLAGDPTFSAGITVEGGNVQANGINSLGSGFTILDSSTGGLNITEDGNSNIAITNNGNGQIQISTTSGSIAITGPNTSEILMAAGGEIELTPASGQVFSATSTGGITLTDNNAAGIIVTESGNGPITFNSSGTGGIAFNTSSTGGVTIQTPTGTFNFFGNGGGMQLATGNASIAISTAGVVTIGAAGGSGFSIAAAGGAITVSGTLSAPSIQTTSNINIFGSITDGNASAGAAGQVLTSTASGVAWHSLLTNSAGAPPTATTDNHIASGTITINGTTPVAVTLSGAGQFSAGTTYVVHLSYNSVPGGAQTGVLYASGQSASGFNITSTDATDTTSTIAWTATGY